jgi:hypothetical protein
VQSLNQLRERGRRHMKKNIVSLEAASKWLKIPQSTRERLLKNVWCAKCLDAVTIVDYVIENQNSDIVLRGTCRSCQSGVTRVVEIDR